MMDEQRPALEVPHSVMVSQIDAAVLAEREACLKLIDAALLVAIERGNAANNPNAVSQLTNYGAAEALRKLAASIRARSE